MAKFHISTPGGYEVEVTAKDETEAVAKARKDWQSMPRIIAKQGKTRVFERSNGQRYVVSPGYSSTNPQKVEEALSGMTGGEISRKGIDEAIIAENPIAARAGEYVRGTPFVGSYADEALGAVLGPQAATAARATSGAMQRQRPGETLALNLAGGVMGSAGAAAAAPAKIAQGAGAILGGGSRASQIGRGLAAGAALGGLEGGIYGAGEGVGEDRVAQAGKGAGFGAVGGGLLGAAAPVAREVAGNIAGLFKRTDVQKIAKEFGISQDAAKVIKNTFEQGGDIDTAIAQVRRAGDDGMVADAGVAAQALLDASKATGGAATRIASEAVEGRATRAAGLLTDALDEKMGFPTAPEALRRGVRISTAPARQQAYDAALSKQIDWRSPAGERLRALLDTTPPEVMARAARTKAMGARSDFLPDYSGEFAPSVRTVSEATPEARDVSQFFEEYASLVKQQGQKRPLTAMMKMAGGIDPSGPAGIELKARGVTSRTHPGLFKRGGLKDVDNLEIDQFPEAMRFGKDTGVYADPEDIYSGLVNEGRGQAVGSAADAELASRLQEMEQMMPEYEARRAALESMAEFPTAPPEVSEAYKVNTVGDIDAIKRALDDIAETNEGLGKMGGQTAFGREAQIRAREIRDALAEAVPEYGKALETGADAISRSNAIKMGAEILRPKTTRDDVAEFVRNATGGELQAARSGLRGYIDDVMANVRTVPSDPNLDAREAIKAVNDMSSRASREKMSMMLGDQAEGVFRALDQASEAFNLRAATSANSRTAIRQAIQGDVEGIVSPGPILTAAKGEPVEATKRIVQALTGVTDEYSAAQKQKIFAEIAKALTEKRGDDAVLALRVLDRAMKGQELTEAQLDQLSNLVAGALFAGTTPQTGRAMGAEYRE